jgi:F420-dependent oxidoreductase-like protein
MRFEFKTANHHSTWDEILAVWREADEIELFDGGWLFDHFYPIVPAPDPMGPCLEAWTMLAALAQATSRLRLGTMVTGMHHRHPAVLAKMVATVDIISGGRLELGLGAGWNDEESDAYGIELGTMRERFDRFDEALHVLASLLSRPTTDFDGTYYRLRDAHCEPKCIQTPHPPILIGGIGEKRTLPAVARYAQRWDSAAASTPAEFVRKRYVLAQYCDEIGRDVGEITTSTHIRWSSDQDVEEVAASAAAFAAAGLDVAIIYLDPPLDPSRLEPLALALGALL